MASIVEVEAICGAGYGIRTRGLNFGKVACCHYTKPACILSTTWSIADGGTKVKFLANLGAPMTPFLPRVWYHQRNEQVYYDMMKYAHISLAS